MRSPLRVESVSILDRNEGFSEPFLPFGVIQSLRDGVTLTGRDCFRSQSSIRTKTLVILWVSGWFRAFAMGPPFWVEFVLWAYALDRNEGLTCTSIL